MLIVREKRNKTVTTAARVQAMDSLTVTALPPLGDTSEVISSIGMAVLVVPSVGLGLVLVLTAAGVVSHGVVCSSYTV